MSKLLKTNHCTTTPPPKKKKKTDDNPFLDLGFDSLQSTCPSPCNTDYIKCCLKKSYEPLKLDIVESIKWIFL